MPDRDRIQAVSVVPTLEPMMMPMLWPSPMMPELTRPTSITVTAPEDWIAMVMTAPSSKPLMGVEVIFLSSCSIRPPASFSSREDMRDMPYRKNAMPPQRVNREKISIPHSYLFLYVMFPYCSMLHDNCTMPDRLSARGKGG